jgi:hypothetical protein
MTVVGIALIAIAVNNLVLTIPFCMHVYSLLPAGIR